MSGSENDETSIYKFSFIENNKQINFFKILFFFLISTFFYLFTIQLDP